jgi:hypothetical protein
MEKKVTKTIVKSLLILTGGIWALHANAQWSPTSSPNPIWTNQSVGIGTSTPMKKLQIASYVTETSGLDNGATLTTDPLHLRLSYIKQSNFNPLANVQNPMAPLVMVENIDWDIDNNHGQLEFNYADNMNSNFRSPFSLLPNGGTFHYDLGVEGNLNVVGTSTLQNANVSDLSTQNLVVNNSATLMNTATFTGMTYFNNFIGGNEVKILGKLAIGGGATPGSFKKASGNFSNYALSVDGTIVATKTVVQIGSWADKVFQKNYKLMSLSEIEDFVTKNKHLPEIPSETEVIENGVDVGEMNKLLLQKVEELTLHLIDLDKKYKSLEAQVKKTGK